MSFSKGIKAGEKPKSNEDVWDVYRPENEICMCAYPSCLNRRIERHQDAVFWDYLNVATEEFNRVNLTPLAKLAVIANPEDFVEKQGSYSVKVALHVECAAEWGMHLIKDALQSHNVGTKLRRGTENAIRKQT